MFLQLLSVAIPLVLSQQVLAIGKPGFTAPTAHFGPEVTVEHLYYENYPTGITVSKTGRKFSNFPRDATYTVGELINGTVEVPFPNLEVNTPPSLRNESNPTYATNYADYLISVQSVIIDAKERLWALDTGRPTLNGTQLWNGGGAKIVAFDLATNSSKAVKTIVLPPNVAYPETVLNDLRFDLRPEITSSGEGVAYITDSSTEGRNGIIVIDLGTGQSWRHLDAHPSTLPDEGLIASYNGEPFLPVYAVNGIRQQWLIGADGIAISPDGEWLYYTPLAARTWYRVPTALLRVPSSGPGSTPTAAWQARRAVEFLGRLPSHADGFESDTNGLVYLTAPETNSIYTWDPKDGQLSLLVRDELIQWADTLSVANDGRIYFTVNTAWLAPNYNNGTNKLIKPYGLLSVPITGGRIELK